MCKRVCHFNVVPLGHCVYFGGQSVLMMYRPDDVYVHIRMSLMDDAAAFIRCLLRFFSGSENKQEKIISILHNEQKFI